MPGITDIKAAWRVSLKCVVMRSDRPAKVDGTPKTCGRNGGESSRRDDTLMTHLIGLPPSVRVESALNRESAPTATCEAATRLRISERF